LDAVAGGVVLVGDGAGAGVGVALFDDITEVVFELGAKFFLKQELLHFVLEFTP